jgi:hypothetical protein
MGRLEREIKNAEAYDDLLKRGVVKKKLDQANRKQIGKLQQYNDPTAHFRMVREEVKIAAEDGIEKLQFPTGRTAMEIEGLGGEPAEWWLIPEGGESNRPMWGNPNSKKITPENLEVGQKINRDGLGTDDWIITDVLGDGKFKAVPKDFEEQIKRFEEASVRRLEQGIDTPEQQARLRAQLAPREETFDISGKVDTSNPIYKFYESTLGKYLTNNFQAKRITDNKGVEWYEIDIEPAFANQPVLAFKMAEDDDSELSNEEARALYEQIAKEEMKYNRDAIDDIIDGKRKILPPTELKSDWMETIGKSAYARIFNKNSLIRADEIASDLGMTEDDLKEEIAKRLRHRELEKEKDKAMDESLKDWAKKELKLFSKDDSYKSISQELKDKIKVFFRPSRKRVSRTFSL